MKIAQSQIKGFIILLLILYFYGTSDSSWLLFFILLFLPDLSALGYLINQRKGAAIYNIFHTYLFPMIVILIGMIFLYQSVVAVGLIWIAHIAMDRMLGYNLRPTEEKVAG